MIPVRPTQGMVWAVIILPATYLMWLSFHTSGFGADTHYVGWANYAHSLGYLFLARPGQYRHRRAGGGAPELLLSLGMALLFGHGLPWRRLVAIVLAPYAVSEVAAVVMWRFLFDPDVGHISCLLNALGLPELEWAVTPAHGLVLVSLLSIWLHLPFTFMLLYAARIALPGEVYEAAPYLWRLAREQRGDA